MRQVWLIVISYLWKYGKLIVESALKAEESYIHSDSKKEWVMQVLKDAVSKTDEKIDDYVLSILDALVEVIVAILHKKGKLA